MSEKTYVIRHPVFEVETYRGNILEFRSFELPDERTVSSVTQQLLNEFSIGPYLISLELVDKEAGKNDVIDRWQIAPNGILNRDDAMVLAAKIIEAIERYEEDENE